MCYAKPAPRCSKHAHDEVVKARERFKKKGSYENKEKLVKALYDYSLSPAGLKELRDSGSIDLYVERSKERDRLLDLAKSLKEAKKTEEVSEGGTETPRFTELASADSEEWLALPWKQRKLIVEEALGEVIQLSGSTASFRRWSRSKRTLGTATTSVDRITGETEKYIDLSDELLRHSEPSTIAHTIAHEVAHTVSSDHAGHGQEWKDNFSKLNRKLGIKDEVVVFHNASKLERAMRTKQMEEKRANAPWQGKCPQGHSFTAGRKPYGRTICVRCNDENKPADITYERNTNR